MASSGATNHDSEVTRDSAADLMKLVEEEYLKPVENLVHEGMTTREKIAAIKSAMDRMNQLKEAVVKSCHATPKVVHPLQERSDFQRSSRMNFSESGGHSGFGHHASVSGKEHAGCLYEIRATMERDVDTAATAHPSYNQTQKKTYVAGSGGTK